MVHQLKITLDKEKCIGNKACLAQDPEHFGFEDGKAVLKESSGYDICTLEGNFTDDQKENVVQAGEVCPVNAITVSEDKEEIVSSTVEKTEDFQRISAEYDDDKEFELDPKGYFLIKIDPATKKIHVGFCTSKNKLQYEVVGEKPLDVYGTILRENIIDRPDHAAYLGRELQKAYVALKKGMKYVQDDELDL